MNLKDAFNYIENPQKVHSKHFNSLMRKLNKPLFPMEEQGLI